MGHLIINSLSHKVKRDGTLVTESYLLPFLCYLIEFIMNLNQLIISFFLNSHGN